MKRFRMPLFLTSLVSFTTFASINIIDTPTSVGFPQDLSPQKDATNTPQGDNVVPGGTAPRGEARNKDTSLLIRERIEKDDRLSDDSKSINVVVQGDTVRLQGTVKSSNERDYLRAHVRHVLGAQIRIDESKLKIDTQVRAR